MTNIRVQLKRSLHMLMSLLLVMTLVLPMQGLAQSTEVSTAEKATERSVTQTAEKDAETQVQSDDSSTDDGVEKEQVDDQLIQLKWTSTRQVVAPNEAATFQLLGSYISEQDIPLAGVQITINGEPLQESGQLVATNAQGEVVVKQAKPGTYTIVAQSGQLTAEAELIVEPKQERVTVSVTGVDVTVPATTVTILNDDSKSSTSSNQLRTALAVLQQVLQEHSISYKMDGTKLVEIGHETTDRFEVVDHWTYTVNGQDPFVPPGEYIVQDGDELHFYYTYDPQVEQQKQLFTTKTEEQTTEDIRQVIDRTAQFMLEKGVESEWEAVGLARAGFPIPASYESIFQQNLQDQVLSKSGSGRLKITDVERLTLAALALGKNPYNIDGKGFSLIDKIVNSEHWRNGEDSLTFQGNNGIIFALIALDAAQAKDEKDAKWNRQKMVHELLKNQKADGSWSLMISEDAPTSYDITAMALIALAPYQETNVRTAVEKAAAFLSNAQGPTGGFDESFSGGISSEATSQVIIGLTANGIDPRSSKFTKNGIDLIDHLLSFRAVDGGFKHLHSEKMSNGMATEQALQALVAYQLFVEGKGVLYSFPGVIPQPDEEEPEQRPQPTEPKPSTKTITFSVEKRTMGEGDIIPPIEVPLFDGETAYTLLQRIADERGIEVAKIGSDSTLYVQGIDGLYEFDGGPLSGWMYSVNGVYPNFSAGLYELQDGDVLRWRYTRDLGRDIGGGWDEPLPDEEEPEQPKPEQPKPEQPKPEQPKPEQPKPEQPKPEQPKPEQPKPEQPKPEQPKPEQPKPEQPKPEQPKPEQPKPEQPKPEQPKPEQPKPEQPKPEQPKPERPKPPIKPSTKTITFSVEKRTMGEGDIIPPTTVPLYDGETAYTLLQRIVDERGIHIAKIGSGSTLYVQGIDGLYEFDGGRWSGWMYSVNGVYPNYSAGLYELQDGDVLRWRYTRDLGRDIGGGWDEPYPDEAEKKKDPDQKDPKQDENKKRQPNDAKSEKPTDVKQVKIEDNKQPFVYEEDEKTSTTTVIADFEKETDILPKMDVRRGLVRLSIPAGTKVTSDWAGYLQLPTVLAVENDLIQKMNDVFIQDGQVIDKIDLRVQTGDVTPLTFDQPVTLTFEGLAHRQIGYFDEKGTFHKIQKTKTTENNQAMIYAYANGKDLVVQTKLLTEFIVYGTKPYEAIEFKDLQGHWAAPYVQEAVRKGYVKGYENGKFKPQAPLTRAQAVSIIVRGLGIQTNEQAPFHDIQQYATETQADIAAAYAYGIVKGKDGAFKPNDQVTRAQLAIMLHRAYEVQTGVYYEAQRAPFTDFGNYDVETVNAISTLYELKIATGDKGFYQPTANTTRAQAAKMFVQFFKAVEEDGSK